MKSNPVLLLAAFLLCTASAFAQGKIQFDWHGDQNLFQASFQIDASSVLVPPCPPLTEIWHYAWESRDVNFESDPLFFANFTISNPYATFNSFGRLQGPGGLYNGFAPDPDDRRLRLAVGARDMDWEAVVCSIRGHTAVNGFISDTSIVVQDRASGETYTETGYWTWPAASAVPEPSAFALLGLGLLGLYMKKAANR
jgi:hypothetical protein